MKARTAMFSIVFVAALALAAGQVRGDLILDQVGATSVSGGLGMSTAPVIQSFKPAMDNIAAVEVYVSGTNALETDVTVKLFASYDYDLELLSGLLASTTKLGAERQMMHMFTWEPVSVTPEQTYYLQFSASDLTIGTSSADQYARGRVLRGGGNVRDTTDAVFRTYAVPEPASLALLVVGLPLLMRRRRAA